MDNTNLIVEFDLSYAGAGVSLDDFLLDNAMEKVNDLDKDKYVVRQTLPLTYMEMLPSLLPLKWDYGSFEKVALDGTPFHRLSNGSIFTDIVAGNAYGFRGVSQEQDMRFYFTHAVMGDVGVRWLAIRYMADDAGLVSEPVNQRLVGPYRLSQQLSSRLDKL